MHGKKGFAMLRKMSFLFGLMLLFGCLAIYLGQDNTWDARDYHFYNGYAALHGRLTWDFAPAMMQSYLNPVFDIINYFLISNLKAHWVGFFHGALIGFALYLVFLMSWLCFKDSDPAERMFYSFLSVVIAGTSSDNLATLGLITNDSKAAFLVVCSTYFFIRYLHTERFYELIAASLILGLCTAFKLTTACYALAAIIAFTWTYRSIKLTSLVTMMIGIGFLLGNGYWMGKLYLNFHSPLFPYYNNLFHSPYAPLASGSDHLYFPHDYFIFPFLVGFYKTTTVEHLRELRFAIVYVLMIIFFCKQYFAPVAISKNGKFLLSWFSSGYLIWFFMFTIFRYALPLELMSGVIIIYLLSQLMTSKKNVRNILFLILISLFLTTVPTRFGRLPYQDAYYSIQTPSIPDHAVVFIQKAPLAYVIPFLNDKAHFVGAVNMVNISQLHQTVNEGLDKIYLLRRINDNSTTNNANFFNEFFKNNYSLWLNDKCESFNTNIGDRLELCGTHLIN